MQQMKALAEKGRECARMGNRVEGKVGKTEQKTK